MKHAWIKYCIVGLVLMSLGSCSTQSNKWANVQFHNINTHYNVWWNGNESLKAGLEILEKQGKDDYTQILPVYKMGTKEDAMAVYPQMDRAIEKGVKGIKKHSILIHGTEYVKYIKECYLLTAYANFYKQDFTATNNTCALIKSQFAGTRAADEATILEARCLIMEEQYGMAESELLEMEEALKREAVDKSQAGKLYMALAESLIPQEKYGKAVKYLKKAIPLTKDHILEARLNFILGQIYQKVDRKTVATKYYNAALKCHPAYEMEFNAKINIASCADLATSDLGKLEKLLDKMLVDKKNEEYRDQIYYAKGEMYMGMKDAKKACDNYKSSVAVATNNKAQKAKSSIRLAEILYELYENYDLSQTYYDTAMQVIKTDYPHYSEIKERYDVLTSLVSYTRVIDRNDSLIMVADMEPDARIAYIEKLIEDLKAAEEEARKQAIIAQFEANDKAQQNTLKGNWYFYNANTVQKGKEQFKDTWGMRMLEDYWFLSNKGTLGVGSMIAGMEMSDMETDETETTDSVANVDSTKIEVNKDDPTDPHNIAYYLKDLPKNEADRDSMNMQTADCLLNAGYMYYEGIRNVQKALECYLRLANDYTDYDGIVRAFYQLYVLYDKQGNTPQSNYYKDMVLRGFPDSDFANLIRDSEYYKELMKRDQRIHYDYEELYTLYRRRRYGDVIAMVNQTVADYPNSDMLPKFRYWKGLAEARLDQKDSAIHVFEKLVNDFPATDSIVPLAQLQLDLLKANGSLGEETDITMEEEQLSKHKEGEQLAPKKKVGGDEEEPLPPEAQMYRYRENMQHYVLIILNDKNLRATEIQIKIANFNSQYYANSGFKVNLFMFTDETQMITIHRFNNAEEAMGYWKHLQRPESPLKGYNKNDYVAIPMSTQNYATFYNKKDVESYMLFFNRYYLKK